MQRHSWNGFATFVDHNGQEIRVYANLVSIKPRHLWDTKGTLKPLDDWVAFLDAFNSGELCKLRLSDGTELEVGIRSPGEDRIEIWVNGLLPGTPIL